MATFMTGFSDTVGLLQSHFAVKKKKITEMRKLLSYWIKISEQEEKKRGVADRNGEGKVTKTK